jgi:ComF family protein
MAYIKFEKYCKWLFIFIKSRIVNRWTEVLYPRHCVWCEQFLKPSSLWQYGCEGCIAGLEAIRGPACSQCGAPFDGIVEGERICPQCLEIKADFQQGIALFRLNEAMRTWIHRLKYYHGLYVLEDLKSFLNEEKERLSPFFEGAILVPVPIHWQRKLQRGYNQSEAIAAIIAKIFPTGGIQKALKKKLFTRPQVELSREKRLKNVAKAFEVKKRLHLDPCKTYILVDDVLTTGSTLRACAKALAQKGAKDIRVWTIARG